MVDMLYYLHINAAKYVLVMGFIEMCNVHVHFHML